MYLFSLLACLAFLSAPAVAQASTPAQALPRTQANIQLSRDGKGLIFRDSGQRFVPWGLNYGPEWGLLEDRWETDWPAVVADFREMRDEGANVVRVHLQFGKFMEAPDRPNEKALARLGRLVKLAEVTGLYLDLTGLGCYRKADVPAWYDALDETRRWNAQVRFWEAVAARCAKSPAIFCYDLMNEPFVPGDRRKPGEWYSGQLLGGFDFVQFITLDPAGRPREEVGRLWIRRLTRGIRRHDRRHLITVGMLPWTPKWGFLSGFNPEKLAPELDFISVHIYPEAGKVPEALGILKRFAAGKPVVVEETFPLACSAAELEQFLLQSRGTASGWLGHYLGVTRARLEERRRAKTLTMGQALMAAWLDLFTRLKPQMVEEKLGPGGLDLYEKAGVEVESSVGRSGVGRLSVSAAPALPATCWPGASGPTSHAGPCEAAPARRAGPDRHRAPG